MSTERKMAEERPICGSRRSLGYVSHVRGLSKVGMEALWACLTYNIHHLDSLSETSCNGTRVLKRRSSSCRGKSQLGRLIGQPCRNQLDHLAPDGFCN